MSGAGSAWLTELRRAVRLLWRSPGYALTVVLTLAAAGGANTAVSAAVYGVLLKPTPIQEPARLVLAWDRDAARNLPVIEISYRQFEEWSRTEAFASTAAIGSSTWPAAIDDRGTATRVSLAGVSSAFFETLGVRPLLGRGFTPEDDRPGATRVAVLGYGIWMRLFGGDRGIIGRTIRLDGPCTVVGVMPRGFEFPRGTDVWSPVVPILAGGGTEWNTDALDRIGVLFMVGRLRDGVSMTAATDDLQRAATAGAAVRHGTSIAVTPFVEYYFGPVRRALFALLAAVALLLLIACANVAGLMLSRIAAHRHDDTVRAALGASRAALVRRWAAEAAVLFAAGTALAVLFGRWMLDALLAIAPVDVAGLAGISLDWRVVGVTLVATAAAAALCGLVALLRASAGSLSQALHRARSTSTRQALRARSALVVLQIAFSLALVAAAVLVVRSFINMRSLDTGFTSDGVLTFGVEPRGVEFSRLNRWVEELTGQLERIDGVESAGAIYLRPLALGPIGQESSVVLEQQPDDVATRRQNPTLNYQVATPGYFAAMRIQLIRGRLFTALDDERHPRVAVVGQSTARRLWPGQDPIGRRMLLPSFIPGDRTAVWRTVIGVVSDVSYRGLADVRLDVYDAAAQAATPATDIVVRAAGDPLRLISAVQATARRLDASVVIDRVTTMDAIVSRETAPWRFSGWVLSVFGGMAFLLAGLGLFALIAVEVGDRRRELAIRMALGAQRHDVVRMILGAAAVRLALGLTLGLGAAAVLARALGALLFGVSPGDAVSYAAAAAIVAIVVGTAAYLPSRRAAATNPTLLLD